MYGAPRGFKASETCECTPTVACVHLGLQYVLKCVRAFGQVILIHDDYKKAINPPVPVFCLNQNSGDDGLVISNCWHVKCDPPGLCTGDAAGKRRPTLTAVQRHASMFLLTRGTVGVANSCPEASHFSHLSSSI